MSDHTSDPSQSATESLRLAIQAIDSDDLHNAVAHLERALELFRRIHEHSDTDCLNDLLQTLFYLGQARNRIGRNDEALLAFDEAAELARPFAIVDLACPTSEPGGCAALVLALMLRAQVLELMGRTPDALQAAEDALSVRRLLQQPDFDARLSQAEIRRLIASLQLKLGNTQSACNEASEAVEAYRSLHESAPALSLELVESLELLGRASFALGAYERSFLVLDEWSLLAQQRQVQAHPLVRVDEQVRIEVEAVLLRARDMADVAGIAVDLLLVLLAMLREPSVHEHLQELGIEANALQHQVVAVAAQRLILDPGLRRPRWNQTDEFIECLPRAVRISAPGEVSPVELLQSVFLDAESAASILLNDFGFRVDPVLAERAKLKPIEEQPEGPPDVGPDHIALRGLSGWVVMPRVKAEPSPELAALLPRELLADIDTEEFRAAGRVGVAEDFLQDAFEELTDGELKAAKELVVIGLGMLEKACEANPAEFAERLMGGLLMAASIYRGLGCANDQVSLTTRALEIRAERGASVGRHWNGDIDASLREDHAEALLAANRPAEALSFFESASNMYQASLNARALTSPFGVIRCSLGMSESLRRVGRGDEGDSQLRAAGQMLLQCGSLSNISRQTDSIWATCTNLIDSDAASDDRTGWSQMATMIARRLDRNGDLESFHAPLLRRLLVDHEVARDARDVDRLLALQTKIVSIVWRLLSQRQFPSDETDAIVMVLPVALHSAGIASWLQSSETNAPAWVQYRASKRDVIETDAAYGALMQLPVAKQVGKAGKRFGARGAYGKQASALFKALDEASEKSRLARAELGRARQTLMASDARFRSAGEIPSLSQVHREMNTLRPGDSRLLCLFTLWDEDKPTPVGILSRPSAPPVFIEFDGLINVMERLERFQPHHDPSNRMRLIPVAITTNAPTEQRSLQELADLVERFFWTPLEDAMRRLGDDPTASQTWSTPLNIASQGIFHQLPLGLRPPRLDRLQVVSWPGLPYLRLATMAGDERPSAASWQIGHDCAWHSDAPLPMAALEANLLEMMVRETKGVLRPFRNADELSSETSAMVACCHGGREAHLASALSFGGSSLDFRQIVEERRAPACALLPVCHAGETRDDTSGNALGTAAGFLLGGSRMVVASGRAVPDLLAPWFTTLLCWYMTHQGLTPYAAAMRARENLGACDFPEGYRLWLRCFLPEALESMYAQLIAAREIQAVPDSSLAWMSAEWPWEGDAAKMLDSDLTERSACFAGLAMHVLTPRASRAGAVRRQLEEMAAFIFILGVDDREAA